MRVRVMTFNIRGSAVDDGENVWPARREMNLAAITERGPDLVGFQELQEGNWEDYGRGLPGYGRIRGPQYNNAEPFCHPSIFWKEPVLEMVDSGEFWLSTTPEEFSASWGTACARSATWVRLRDAESGLPLFVLNTHLDHVSERARARGVALILREIARLRAGGEPAVVTGDFNCPPGGEVYAAFAEAGFLDAWLAGGGREGEEEGTFHDFTGRRDGVRMDWILVDPGTCTLTCSRAEIVRDARPPVYPSDHFPVVVDLEIDVR